MDQTVNQTVKRLNGVHQVVIITLVVLMLAAMFGLFKLFASDADAGVVAERYAIGLTLIAIPLSLRLYANKINKINKIKKTKWGCDGMGLKMSRFKNAFYLRISILSVVGFVNILLYSIMQNSNFMWLAAITFIAFAFCRTSAGELAGVIAEKEEVSEDE